MIASDLVSILGEHELLSGSEEIKGLFTDSRQVIPGSVFVAVNGSLSDGHNYIKQALDNGAVAVVCEKMPVAGLCDKCIKVHDSRFVWSQLCSRFFSHPSKKIRIHAVTGTNGKTTVAFILRHLLGNKCGLISTVFTDCGAGIEESCMTTPDAYSLQKSFKDMVDSGYTDCVMEVSSHALAQKRVGSTIFETCAFTNLTRDHLDYHGDVDAYFNAKKALFTEYQINSNRVINLENSAGKELLELCKHETVLTYGIGKGDLCAENINEKADGLEFEITHKREKVKVSTSLVCRHNVENILAAIGCALSVGLDLGLIVEKVKSFSGVPGRMEFCGRNDRGAIFFVDYAHTPDAIENVLKSVRSICKGRVITVFGCGGDRDSGKRPLMAKAALNNSDYVFLTEDNPRTESLSQIIDDTEKGFSQNGFVDYRIIESRQDAIEAAADMAEDSDIVCVLGKGHEKYIQYANEKISFDDCIEIKRAIGIKNEC